MPLGGSLTTWGTADGVTGHATSFSAVNVGLQTGGTGPMVRIGCPSLYSMTSFSDIAYPSDIIPPVDQSNTWYVNPTTGNDSNLTTEPRRQRHGKPQRRLPPNRNTWACSTATPRGARRWRCSQYRDTSGGPLVSGTSTLTFSTQGLKVQPLAGQSYIKCQAEEFLSNKSFTPTAGLSKTYQTTDTQANVVAWENDKWMWHVKSASYGGSAAVTDPQTGVTTNYASTGAALDAVAGSFYTDGTKLYIHPFRRHQPGDGWSDLYTIPESRSVGWRQLLSRPVIIGPSASILGKPPW